MGEHASEPGSSGSQTNSFLLQMHEQWPSLKGLLKAHKEWEWKGRGCERFYGYGFDSLDQNRNWLGMVVHTFDPSTQENEAGDLRRARATKRNKQKQQGRSLPRCHSALYHSWEQLGVKGPEPLKFKSLPSGPLQS